MSAQMSAVSHKSHRWLWRPVGGIGVNFLENVGAHMVTAEHEHISESGGGAPGTVQRQSPGQEVKGRRSTPEAEGIFDFHKCK